MTEKHVTWKQALAWRWQTRTATLAWTTPDGRQHHRTDRAGPNVHTVFGEYARRGRLDEIREALLSRRVRDVLYVIELPPMPLCRRCKIRTWNLHPIGRTCRPRCAA